MAHGKAAARDLQWGRQGGGWQEATGAEAIEAIAAARAAGQASGTWPDTDPRSFAPTDELGWIGVARMARARRAAGVPLSATDLQALEAYPDELTMTDCAAIAAELLEGAAS